MGGSWEFVHSQVLMHFSLCAPPHRFHDAEDIMNAAARVADTLTRGAGA